MLTIAHFEITGKDVDGLAGFYSKILGWKAEPAGFLDGYTMLYEGGPEDMTGAVMSTSYQTQPTIIWFASSDIDADIAAVIAAGGKAAGDVNALPDGRRTAYVADPAGNLFGLTQGA